MINSSIKTSSSEIKPSLFRSNSSKSLSQSISSSFRRIASRIASKHSSFSKWVFMVSAINRRVSGEKSCFYKEKSMKLIKNFKKMSFFKGNLSGFFKVKKLMKFQCFFKEKNSLKFIGFFQSKKTR